jgi:hypothetical protein
MNSVDQICHAVMQAAQFPPSFQFLGADLSEDEDQFNKHRDKLAGLFRSLLQIGECTQAPILAKLSQAFRVIFDNFAGYSI